MVLDTGAVIVEFQDIQHPLYTLIPLAGPKIKKTLRLKSKFVPWLKLNVR